MTSQPPSDTANRISRIERGLLPETTLRCQASIPKTLAERMDYYKVPGVSVAVIDHGEIAWTRGYGVRDATGFDAVTPETLFQAASISKPVAATAALRLVQEGTLSLDEDINTYLRSWKLPANDGWQPRVTIRQLVSHTAGLTVHGFPGYAQADKLPTLQQILDGKPPANTTPIRVDTLPDLQMRYAGGGYCVLQQLLIDVTSMLFPSLMRRLVLDPLGMERSTYEQPLPADRLDEAALGHPTLNSTPLGGGYHTYPEMAAAGLWTTSSDLAHFAIELQRAWAGESSNVLSQATAKHMLTPQVEDQIGLGIFLEGKGRGARFGHTGWNEGYICKLEAYVDGGQGAVVMTNGQGGISLCDELFRAIAQEYSWPDYGPSAPVTSSVAPQLLAAYAGEYTLASGAMLRATVDEHGLQLHMDNQLAIVLQPESESDFFAQVVNTGVSFVKNEAGMVEGLLLKQNGKELRASKGSQS